MQEISRTICNTRARDSGKMKTLATLLALVLAAIAIAACGSDSKGESQASEDGVVVEAKETPKGQKLKIKVAPKGQAFVASEAVASPGKMKLELDNPQTQPHDLTIKDSSGKKIEQTYYLSEMAEAVDVDLKPGEYTFYCSMRGHRKEGMEGTLTVE